jgi:hypothetical protein
MGLGLGLRLRLRLRFLRQTSSMTAMLPEQLWSYARQLRDTIGRPISAGIVCQHYIKAPSSLRLAFEIDALHIAYPWRPKLGFCPCERKPHTPFHGTCSPQPLDLSAVGRLALSADSPTPSTYSVCMYLQGPASESCRTGFTDLRQSPFEVPLPPPILRPSDSVEPPPPRRKLMAQWRCDRARRHLVCIR